MSPRAVTSDAPILLYNLLKYISDVIILDALPYCNMGGSGGGQGVQWDPPPIFAKVVGFLTLGRKLDPLLDPLFWLVDL